MEEKLKGRKGGFMDSDFKLIGILSLIVIILGIIFTIRITIFKDDGFLSPNTNLATTDTSVSETDINSISTTNNDINNTKEWLERENEINEEMRKDELEREEMRKKSKEFNEELRKYENKQQVKSGILYILLLLIILSILYYIFKNYSFKTGLIAYSTYAIILSCIQNGFHFLTIFLSLIVALIVTTITYIVYTKSKSFLNFVLKILLVGIGIFVILVILRIVISMINGNSGIL